MVRSPTMISSPQTLFKITSLVNTFPGLEKEGLATQTLFGQ